MKINFKVPTPDKFVEEDMEKLKVKLLLNAKDEGLFDDLDDLLVDKKNETVMIKGEEPKIEKVETTTVSSIHTTTSINSTPLIADSDNSTVESTTSTTEKLQVVDTTTSPPDVFDGLFTGRSNSDLFGTPLEMSPTRDSHDIPLPKMNSDLFLHKFHSDVIDSPAEEVTTDTTSRHVTENLMPNSKDVMMKTENVPLGAKNDLFHGDKLFSNNDMGMLDNHFLQNMIRPTENITSDTDVNMDIQLKDGDLGLIDTHFLKHMILPTENTTKAPDEHTDMHLKDSQINSSKDSDIGMLDNHFLQHMSLPTENVSTTTSTDRNMDMHLKDSDLGLMDKHFLEHMSLPSENITITPSADTSMEVHLKDTQISGAKEGEIGMFDKHFLEHMNLPTENVTTPSKDTNMDMHLKGSDLGLMDKHFLQHMILPSENIIETSSTDTSIDVHLKDTYPLSGANDSDIGMFDKHVLEHMILPTENATKAPGEHIGMHFKDTQISGAKESDLGMLDKHSLEHMILPIENVTTTPSKDTMLDMHLKESDLGLMDKQILEHMILPIENVTTVPASDTNIDMQLKGSDLGLMDKHFHEHMILPSESVTTTLSAGTDMDMHLKDTQISGTKDSDLRMLDKHFLQHMILPTENVATPSADTNIDMHLKEGDLGLMDKNFLEHMILPIENVTSPSADSNVDLHLNDTQLRHAKKSDLVVLDKHVLEHMSLPIENVSKVLDAETKTDIHFKGIDLGLMGKHLLEHKILPSENVTTAPNAETNIDMHLKESDIGLMDKHFLDQMILPQENVTTIPSADTNTDMHLKGSDLGLMDRHFLEHMILPIENASTTLSEDTNLDMHLKGSDLGLMDKNILEHMILPIENVTTVPDVDTTTDTQVKGMTIDGMQESDIGLLDNNFLQKMMLPEENLSTPDTLQNENMKDKSFSGSKGDIDLLSNFEHNFKIDDFLLKPQDLLPIAVLPDTVSTTLSQSVPISISDASAAMMKSSSASPIYETSSSSLKMVSGTSTAVIETSATSSVYETSYVSLNTVSSTTNTHQDYVDRTSSLGRISLSEISYEYTHTTILSSSKIFTSSSSTVLSAMPDYSISSIGSLQPSHIISPSTTASAMASSFTAEYSTATDGYVSSMSLPDNDLTSIIPKTSFHLESSSSSFPLGTSSALHLESSSSYDDSLPSVLQTPVMNTESLVTKQPLDESIIAEMNLHMTESPIKYDTSHIDDFQTQTISKSSSDAEFGTTSSIRSIRMESLHKDSLPLASHPSIGQGIVSSAQDIHKSVTPAYFSDKSTIESSMILPDTSRLLSTYISSQLLSSVELSSSHLSSLPLSVSATVGSLNSDSGISSVDTSVMSSSISSATLQLEMMLMEPVKISTSSNSHLVYSQTQSPLMINTHHSEIISTSDVKDSLQSSTTMVREVTSAASSSPAGISSQYVHSSDDLPTIVTEKITSLPSVSSQSSSSVANVSAISMRFVISGIQTSTTSSTALNSLKHMEDVSNQQSSPMTLEPSRTDATYDYDGMSRTVHGILTSSADYMLPMENSEYLTSPQGLSNVVSKSSTILYSSSGIYGSLIDNELSVTSKIDSSAYMSLSEYPIERTPTSDIISSQEMSTYYTDTESSTTYFADDFNSSRSPTSSLEDPIERTSTSSIGASLGISTLDTITESSTTYSADDFSSSHTPSLMSSLEYPIEQTSASSIGASQGMTMFYKDIESSTTYSARDLSSSPSPTSSEYSIEPSTTNNIGSSQGISALYIESKSAPTYSFEDFSSSHTTSLFRSVNAIDTSGYPRTDSVIDDVSVSPSSSFLFSTYSTFVKHSFSPVPFVSEISVFSTSIGDILPTSSSSVLETLLQTSGEFSMIGPASVLSEQTKTHEEEQEEPGTSSQRFSSFKNNELETYEIAAQNSVTSSKVVESVTSFTEKTTSLDALLSSLSPSDSVGAGLSLSSSLPLGTPKSTSLNGMELTRPHVMATLKPPFEHVGDDFHAKHQHTIDIDTSSLNIDPSMSSLVSSSESRKMITPTATISTYATSHISSGVYHSKTANTTVTPADVLSSHNMSPGAMEYSSLYETTLMTSASTKTHESVTNSVSANLISHLEETSHVDSSFTLSRNVADTKSTGLIKSSQGHTPESSHEIHITTSLPTYHFDTDQITMPLVSATNADPVATIALKNSSVPTGSYLPVDKEEIVATETTIVASKDAMTANENDMTGSVKPHGTLSTSTPDIQSTTIEDRKPSTTSVIAPSSSQITDSVKSANTFDVTPTSLVIQSSTQKDGNFATSMREGISSSSVLLVPSITRFTRPINTAKDLTQATSLSTISPIPVASSSTAMESISLGSSSTISSVMESTPAIVLPPLTDIAFKEVASIEVMPAARIDAKASTPTTNGITKSLIHDRVSTTRDEIVSSPTPALSSMTNVQSTQAMDNRHSSSQFVNKLNETIPPPITVSPDVFTTSSHDMITSASSSTMQTTTLLATSITNKLSTDIHTTVTATEGFTSTAAFQPEKTTMILSMPVTTSMFPAYTESSTATTMFPITGTTTGVLDSSDINTATMSTITAAIYKTTTAMPTTTTAVLTNGGTAPSTTMTISTTTVIDASTVIPTETSKLPTTAMPSSLATENITIAIPTSTTTTTTTSTTSATTTVSTTTTSTTTRPTTQRPTPAPITRESMARLAQLQRLRARLAQIQARNRALAALRNRTVGRNAPPSQPNTRFLGNRFIGRNPPVTNTRRPQGNRFTPSGTFVNRNSFNTRAPRIPQNSNPQNTPRRRGPLSRNANVGGTPRNSNPNTGNNRPQSNAGNTRRTFNPANSGRLLFRPPGMDTSRFFGGNNVNWNAQFSG